MILKEKNNFKILLTMENIKDKFSQIKKVINNVRGYL